MTTCLARLQMACITNRSVISQSTLTKRDGRLSRKNWREIPSSTLPCQPSLDKPCTITVQFVSHPVKQSQIPIKLHIFWRKRVGVETKLPNPKSRRVITLPPPPSF